MKEHNDEHKNSDTLKALKISIAQAQSDEFRNGYYILNINFEEKVVRVTSFPKELEVEASNMYADIEKEIAPEKNAVVLVSVPKIKKLKEAYPS